MCAHVSVGVLERVDQTGHCPCVADFAKRGGRLATHTGIAVLEGDDERIDGTFVWTLAGGHLDLRPRGPFERRMKHDGGKPDEQRACFKQSAYKHGYGTY